LATGFEKPPYGLVIFDSTAENPIAFQNNIISVKKIAMVAVALTINEELRTKIDYARILDEHADGFCDEFRNTPSTLTSFAKKIQAELEQIEIELPRNKHVKRALAHATNIIEISSGFEKKSNEFLLGIQLRMSDLNIQEHDLQEFIESVAAEFAKEKEVEQKKVCVELNFKKLARNKKVRFDREKIRECLWAIMDNAVKHEAKNIYFDIAVKYKKTSVPHVVLTILNDGSLIDPRIGRQLLQHFSSTDRQTGSGGLATAKSIIQTHGGKIDLETEPETKFTIELPIV
jgi:signal transduction histidine kinase